ncbi:MAG: hypothetical protein KKG59_03295 [Nanoarchaeota archaeon]|nr:hypothetical protein [Nanoarchaeota archaeon]
MHAQTTIRIDKHTKEHLDTFKLVPQESMDHVLRRMLNLLEDLLDDKISMHTGETVRNKLNTAHQRVSRNELKKRMFKYEV